MLTHSMKLLTGLVGLVLVCVFVIGLAHSIAVGFAGFKGALPFLIIVAIVLPMAAYDYWDECVRKKDSQ